MSTINIGFSSCPNDTYIFHAMIHNLVDTKGLTFTPHMHDVEELNQMAFSRSLHVTKLSFNAYLRLKDTYELLDSGAALGFGCGPLLVGRTDKTFSSNMKVAVPGEYTTALLLLNLWEPEITHIEITRFDNILEGVQNCRFDAGLIIHEGRFIYPNYGLVKIVDLGEWWEKETGHPIPLGCIAIRKDQASLKSSVETIIRDSIHYAREYPDASRSFIKHHAQEMDDMVINNHIRLYVNEFTISLGQKGMQSIQKLEETARWKNVLW